MLIAKPDTATWEGLNPDSSGERADFLRFMRLGIILLDLLVVTLAGVSIDRSYHQAEDRARVAAQGVALLLESDLSGWFDRIDLGLAAVRDEAERALAAGAAKPGDIDRFIVRQLARQPALRDLGLASADGSITMGTGIGAAPLNIAERPYFQKLRDVPDAGLVISKPFQRYRNGEWLVSLARRVNRPGGQFGGVVVGLITLDHFHSLFASLDLGGEGIVSLRDLESSLIIQYPESAAAVGSAATGPESAAALRINPDEGTYRAIDGDGRHSIVAYKKLGPYPYHASVALFAVDYLAPWRLYTIAVCGLSSVILAISVIAGRMLTRSWNAREEAFRRVALSGQALQKSEEYLSLSLESAGLGVWELDQASGTLIADTAGRQLFGFPLKGPLRREQVRAAMHPDDRPLVPIFLDQAETPEGGFDFQFRCIHPDSTVHWLSLRGRGHIGGPGVGAGRLIGVVQDITERKAAEIEIQNLAFYDPLTGLPNRRLLYERIKQALSLNARTGNGGALIFFDLDKFKRLNDTHGHDVGDLLLQQVAQRLMANVRQVDTVARLGGDEFVVMLQDLSKNVDEAQKQARGIGEKILAALNRPYQLGDLEYHSTASIGVTMITEDPRSIDAMLKLADTAMYRSKKAGGNTLSLITRSDDGG